MSYKITINLKQIRDKIDEATYNKSRAAAKLKAVQVTESRKKDFLDKFINHPVSQEILAGPIPNEGVNGQNGNLFSFIGFSAGSTPVQDLYNYFNSKIKLNPSFQYNKITKTFSFKISIPSIDEIKQKTDLSDYTDNMWGSGRSWIYSIERGIPGLNRYKYSVDKKVLGGDSRSGTGLERRNIIHAGASYKARKYITDLLKILITRKP